MTTREVAFVNAGSPRSYLAPPDAPQTHLAPFWATVAFRDDYRVWQPTEPVYVRDVNTSASIVIAPTLIDDMPPSDADIVYRATFVDGRLTGRLVPERTLTTAATKSREAFAPRSDATALFFMRYMPASRASLLAMQDSNVVDVVVQLLTDVPGILALLGFIDVQGAQQAYRDFYPDLPYATASAEWWHQLLTKSRMLQNTCAAHDIHQLRNNASLTHLLATLQDPTFHGATRTESTSEFWTVHVAELRTAICKFFIENGRVGIHTQDFAEALRSYDLLFWRGTAASIRTSAAGWIEPPATLHDVARRVHAAIERLPSALPVVVFANAEQWTPHGLTFALATLLLAVPKQPGANGKFAITGSCVPIKIVVLFNTDNYAGANPALTPQHKL